MMTKEQQKLITGFKKMQAIECQRLKEHLNILLPVKCYRDCINALDRAYQNVEMLDELQQLVKDGQMEKVRQIIGE